MNSENLELAKEIEFNEKAEAQAILDYTEFLIGLVAPTYTETNIPVEKEEIVEEETKDSDTYRA